MKYFEYELNQFDLYVLKYRQKDLLNYVIFYLLTNYYTAPKMQKTWQVKMNFIAPLKVQVNFRQTEKLIYATVYAAAQWAQVYNYFKPCNLSAFKRSHYSVLRQRVHANVYVRIA